MTDFRTVSEDFAVSPQISVVDVAAAASLGFTLIVNNRPDGEAPGQPAGALIEAAARTRGLDYIHVPILGRPSDDQVKAVREAVASATGKTLAFCRSGTRSINAWALGQRTAGVLSRERLIQIGADAGYDLAGVLPP